jgi:hypothetical protein
VIIRAGDYIISGYEMIGIDDEKTNITMRDLCEYPLNIIMKVMTKALVRCKINLAKET